MGSAFVTVAIGQTLPANCSAYASVPLPPEANEVPVPSASPACASYRSYQGIGRPVDYSKARKCAWRERLAQKAGLQQSQADSTAWIVGGSLILADIYINGKGVKRNVPLAVRFACEAEDRMAMLALTDIRTIEHSPRPHGVFEFCDYARSTITASFCLGYSSEVEDAQRNRYYNSLKASMTPEQRRAFEALLKAENAYIEAHASEVYQGGTIRAMRTIGSQDILKSLFHTEIVHFERKKWPKLSNHQISNHQIRTADAALEREYHQTLQQLREQSKESMDEDAVKPNDLSRVEEAWKPYREAWSAFARLRYPAAAPAIRAKITLDRYRLIKTIGSY